METINIKYNLLREYQTLTNEYWKFLNYGLPIINQKKISYKKANSY
jgi:hypothetical protein